MAPAVAAPAKVVRGEGQQRRAAAAVPWPAQQKSSKALSDTAVEKMRAGDYAAAETLLRRALAINRYNIEALMSLCGMQAREKKYEEALKSCSGAYSAVYASSGFRAPGLNMLASEAEFESYRLLSVLGRRQEAAEALRSCVKRARRDWPGLARATEELKGL